MKKKFVKKTKKKLISKLIVSSFFKNKINFVFINVISMIIKLHLNSILCFIICPDISFRDFWLQILVSFFVTFSGDYVIYHLNQYDKDFYKITRYFLNNLTEKNFDKWKKILVLGLNFYLITILLFVSVTSYLIIYYCVQYLVFFFILDYFKNQKWMIFINWFNEYMSQPIIIKKYDTLQIIDEHFNKEEMRNNIPKLKIEDINVDYFNISKYDAGSVENKEEETEEEMDISENRVRGRSLDEDEYEFIN
jgi:hypothetical protein